MSIIAGAQEIVPPPEYIKSILLGRQENQQYIPFVPVNGTFSLSFDDLQADEKDYYYKIEHCDKNWQTSDLLTTDYVTGYASEKIYNFENSFNTLQDFTHYQLRIPNSYTRLKISGNYRISVLDEDENVVFSRYFVLYESAVDVGVSVHRSRDVQYLGQQQSVHFIINNKNFRIDNPSEEIYPVIVKNYNFATQIKGLKPQFFRNGQLIYKYDKETAFNGGNEYLNFDTKDIYNSNSTVARIRQGEDIYHAFLYLDRDRSHDTYTYYPDIDGNYVVRNINAENQDLEADYMYVHFALDAPEGEDDVYVYGGFNRYLLSDENKMTYKPETRHYETDILLKQGFYNYTYVVKDEEGNVDDIYFNGNHEETENTYFVIVYYSKAGSYYDRVIGLGRGSSNQLH